MIGSIEFENFQSHENSILKFSPGINAITGPSDSGKSAVLRAFYWVVNNRPSGESFISYWAKNDKGKQIKPTFVKIINQKGEMERRRDSSFNGYIENVLDGEKELEAVRTDVPEEVQSFFNLSEVNIQKQMDAPFLLSETSGEVARFFNRIIKLDEIDTALSLIDSKKRTSNNTIKNLQFQIEENEKSLKKYEWIEKTEPLIEKWEKINNKINEKTTLKNNVEESIQQMEFNTYKMKKLTPLINLQDKVDEIQKINVNIGIKDSELVNLKSSLDNWEITQLNIEKTKPLLELETSVDKLLNLMEEIQELSEKKENYSKSLENFQEISQKIPIISKELKTLEKQLPDVCPLCGLSKEEEKHGNH